MEGGPPSFTPDYSSRALLRNSTTHSSSLLPTGLSPSMAPHSKGLRLASPYACVGPTTPRPQGPRFGLYPFRSPLLRASRLISLSTGYLDVSVPLVSSSGLRRKWLPSLTVGFPHSAILGSSRVCRSPKLIAAYRGLRRLRVPRHPPLAFIRLTTKSSNRLRAIYSSDTKKLCHCVDSFSHEHYPIPLSKSMCHARSLRCFCGAPARQFCSKASSH